MARHSMIEGLNVKMIRNEKMETRMTPESSNGILGIQLVDAEQLAEILAVPKSHVYAMAEKGQIPFVRVGKKYIRFNPDKVLATLESRSDGSAEK